LDNLSERITEILQDPDRLKQITDIAASMGLSPDNIGSTAPSIPIGGAVEQISQIIQQAESRESRQKTLIQALLPYLKPNRQARLERAMQLSQLSMLAGTALQGRLPFVINGGGDHNV